jgi:hypothetical protein
MALAQYNASAGLLTDASRANNQAWYEACAIIQHRRQSDSPVKRDMADIAQRYNADFTIPLSDVQGEPEFPMLSASIIADAIDGSATRANDTLPVINAPPIDNRATARAFTRGRAWQSHWDESQIQLRLGRAYRQFFGYATFGLFVVPDYETECAKIITRDPLVTYPEPMSSDEVRAPRNVGFVYGRSPSWLKAKYPAAADLIRRHTSREDDLWDVLEWIDEDRIMIGILGKRAPENWSRRFNADGSVNYGMAMEGPLDQALLLRAYPNRAGMVTGVCPSAVTLDRMVSGLKRIVPITDLMNKIAALDFLAAERGVFPDRYVVGDGQGAPRIVGGQWRDGRTGRINILESVKTVGDLQSQPGPQTQQLLSTLERNARVSSGNPAVFQGEMSGSVRSGQTISQLGAFSVDPRIKEAHIVMQYALKIINESVAEVEKGYWPNKKYTVFSGLQGDDQLVDYVPSEIWTETTRNIVEYSMPGMDATNATIALGQLNGAKLMSRRTARVKHPLIDAPDVEEQQLLVESVTDLIEGTAAQLVASNTFPFTDLVRIRKMVQNGMDLSDAVAKVQEEAQQRQASQAPPPGDGMGASPEAQPGIEAPGAGAEMQPPGGEQNLTVSPRLQLRALSNALTRPPPTAQSAPAGGPPVPR